MADTKAPIPREAPGALKTGCSYCGSGYGMWCMGAGNVISPTLHRARLKNWENVLRQRRRSYTAPNCL